MGLFGRKKKKKEIDGSEYQWLTVDEALSLSKDGIKKGRDSERYLDSIQEQLKNAERIKNETGHEFEQIEKYLGDIQRFDGLPKELKTKIKDISSNLIGYEKQRQDYQEGSRLISEDKYRTMDIYREEIPEKLKIMEEQENYLTLVKNDMRQIEGEKGSIKYEKEEAEKKKKFLIKFTEISVAAVVAVSIIFLVVSSYAQKSMMLPFMVLAAVVSIYLAYFVVSMKNCNYTISKNERLMNRAIELLNKVKIKYVNTVNALDYTYEKYKCNSHQELAFIWQGYLKEKEEERKYKKNTGLLAACQDSLIEVLNDAGFSLSQVWVHQAELFTDKTGMREFKDVLLERHRKLKAQLEFNSKQKAGMVSELKAYVLKHPEFSDLIEDE